MNVPDTIACYLNDILKQTTCFKNAAFFPIVEDVTKDGKSWPVHNANGTGTGIKPGGENKFYWKIISAPVESADEAGYGENPKRMDMTLRLYFVGLLSAFPLSCVNTALEAFTIAMDALPMNTFAASSALPGGTITLTESELDKETIIESEYPGFQLSQKFLDLVTFSVTLNYSGMYCSTC